MRWLRQDEWVPGAEIIAKLTELEWTVVVGKPGACAWQLYDEEPIPIVDERRRYTKSQFEGMMQDAHIEPENYKTLLRPLRPQPPKSR